MACPRLFGLLLLAARGSQGIRISDSSPAELAEPPAGDSSSPCSGCELTVDMRCDGLRPNRGKRGAPYHRIQDCLLPMYGLIDLARNASALNGSKVCVVTWLDTWEGLTLLPYVKNVSGVAWHSIISEREECTKELRYHAINRTKWYFASDEYIQGFGSDKNMIEAHPINIQANVEGIHNDADRYTGAEGDRSGIILISRESGARMFRPVARESLKQSLERVILRPVTPYLGKEPFCETLRMFNKAAGVIGYHGAAWANTYFITQRHCSVQISTFSDLDGKTPWRISSELLFDPEVTKGVWSFYYLPLDLLLSANHVTQETFSQREDKDHFVKDFVWIPLRSVDIADITSQMSNCLANPDLFEAVHPSPQIETRTQGWGEEDFRIPAGYAAATAEAAPEERDPCTGCDFTVDLRCNGMRDSRTDYYHMLTQCLFPAYEMFQLAREAASNQSAQVCAITWGAKDGATLTPFLRELVDIPWYKIVDEGDECAQNLRYHAANRTVEFGASEEHERRFGTDRNMVRSYPVDKQWNLKWLLQDAVNIAGRPNPHIVVIQNQRRGVFPEGALRTLAYKLSEIRPVTIYTGKERVLDTVKIFTNAAAIAGYQGPAWANGLMVATPHCILQYSTYEDFEKEKKWKVTEDVKKWNTNGDWRYFFIPLAHILEGNNVSAETYNASTEKSQLLQELPWAPVAEDEVYAASVSIRLCWQNKWIAYRRQLVAYGKYGNNQDHGY